MRNTADIPLGRLGYIVQYALHLTKTAQTFTFTSRVSCSREQEKKAVDSFFFFFESAARISGCMGRSHVSSYSTMTEFL